MIKTLSIIPKGYEAHLIEVEGVTNNGLPHFNIIGMGNKTIDESKDRIRAALKSSGFSFPDRKLTINLAPAELNKDGSFLDLPIALNILVLSNQLLPKNTENAIFVGELSLSGTLKPVRGIINIIEAAKSLNYPTIYIPEDNLPEASLITDINIIGVNNIRQLFLHLKSITSIDNIAPRAQPTQPIAPQIELHHIHDQDTAKRALTIAMAGHHNVLLSGPPGAGKTMLARAALSLLPPPSPTEQIAITKIHSITSAGGIISTRPFRTPHHTASPTAIIGGGSGKIFPGEVSLAHHGILFLDEIPEFPRSVLETLRQPLEDKTITINRAYEKVTYPADFILIATENPCPCGFYGDPTHECTCSATNINNYRKKLSGPLLDRIDLFVSVQKIDTADLLKITTPKITDVDVKSTILGASKLQHERYGRDDLYNSSLSSATIRKSINISTEARRLLDKASKKLSLSARSYFKIIKIARTIADLAESENIDETHIKEALSYRQPRTS